MDPIKKEPETYETPDNIPLKKVSPKQLLLWKIKKSEFLETS